MFRRQQQTRNAPRLPSFGRAEILDTDGRPVQHCIVKEISRTGANIVPENPETLPDVCEFWVPHLDLTVRAFVRWRRKNRAGLEFAKPVAATRLVGLGQSWETGS